MNEDDLFKKVFEAASDHDKAVLVSARNGLNQAIKSHNADGSGAKKLKDAQKFLSDSIISLAEKYNVETGYENKFTNKKEVLDHLQDTGWQISKTQFYEHCKQGLLRPEKTGGYSEKSVERYAKRWLRLLETGQKVSDRLDKIQEEKSEIELQQARVKLAREEYELDVKRGRFVPRDQFELAIVARVVAFAAHINHAIEEHVQDWIAIVTGDQARAPELVEAIAKEFEQRMADFAADAEFDIILEANDE